jgi:cytochrome c-type biogenesis protein CcmH
LSAFTLTTPFLIAICVLTVAAAAPLMLALLGRGRPDASQREAQRARSALAAARSTGVLNQEEYETKLAGLPVMQTYDVAPVAGRLAITILVMLPLGALLLYAKFGEPRALDPALLVAGSTSEGQPAPDMAAALAGLEQRLSASPDDAEGWRLLALGYQNTQQFDKALDAMRKVRDLMPEDVDTQVAYAEALALASPTRRIEGEAAEIIDRALQRDPQNQRALWLAGMAGAQQGDTATALKHWRALEASLPEGSENRATISAHIERIAPGATAAAPQPAATPAATPAETAPAQNPVAEAPASGRQISVHVSLDPKLQDRVAAGDTLFVFARAANGPRMPLAIQRLTAADLPAVVTLDDSMSMMPAMKLSLFPDIVIGARISRTGNATPSSGDLQVLTETITQSAIKDRVQLTISEVIP